MPISKPAQAAPWTQALAREAARPVFPRLPPGVRPFLLAVLLFGIVSALMYVGNAALLHSGLPWGLVSVLVVVAVANLWGVRPAVLVLALSAIYGVAVIPRLSPLPSPSSQPPSWPALAVRTAVFLVCGAATIWLTRRAHQMHEKAERRREVVAALQSMILPDTLAAAPGYDLCSLYRPAHHEEEVGGDFYDFYPCGAGLYGLMIGDVMGKGKEAAASTALLRYSVRAFTSTGASPAQVMGRLNSMIETQETRFGTATLFLGLLDPVSGSLCYANAGHEPPLLRRAGGAEEVLGATGPILGIGFEATYEEDVVALDLRDALLLMTDGVTEARNAQGAFLDGAGAWRLLRAALRAPSAQGALASLDSALAAYIGTGPCDDIAMVLLRRTLDRSDPSWNVHADGIAAGRTAQGQRPR